jgi:hypothetical protein
VRQPFVSELPLASAHKDRDSPECLYRIRCANVPGGGRMKMPGRRARQVKKSA